MALAGAAAAVEARASAHQQTNAAVGQDALLHGEALLVVATSNAHDVALELVTESVGSDLSAHALLVEATESALVIDFDELLGALEGIGDIDLHR